MFSDLHTSISRLSIEFCRAEEQPLERFLLAPGSGCCLYVTDKTELIVIQICIQKETFCQLSRLSLPEHAPGPPKTSVHFQFTEYACIRVLLEMMVIEYAHRQEDTQSMLFSFASAFFLQAARYGRAAGQLCDAEPLSDRLLRYIEDHSDTVTLKALSDRFFYQPGYLSALIKRKFGKSFTALLSDQRMKKGGILLKNTSLSVEEIARAIGYSNVSSFYRCFRKYYHMSPREYAERYS